MALNLVGLQGKCNIQEILGKENIISIKDTRSYFNISECRSVDRIENVLVKLNWEYFQNEEEAIFYHLYSFASRENITVVYIERTLNWVFLEQPCTVLFEMINSKYLVRLLEVTFTIIVKLKKAGGYIIEIWYAGDTCQEMQCLWRVSPHYFIGNK